MMVENQPDAPTVVRVNSEGLNVEVTWNAVDGAVKYYIRRNGVDVGTTTETLFEDTVPTDAPYSYRVCAQGADGKFSAWSTVTNQSAVFVGNQYPWLPPGMVV